MMQKLSLYVTFAGLALGNPCLEASNSDDDSDSIPLIQVNIKNKNGEVCSPYLENDSTIERLKRNIEDSCIVSYNKQVLTFKGKALDNNTTLKEAGLKNDDTIIVSPTPSITLYRQTDKSHPKFREEFVLKGLKHSTTIAELKLRMHKQTGTVPSQLVFNSRELEDRDTLGDKEIWHGSDVQVVFPEGTQDHSQGYTPTQKALYGILLFAVGLGTGYVSFGLQGKQDVNTKPRKARKSRA